MNIRLIVVGKTVNAYLIEGEKDYQKRLIHYVKFDQEVIPELKNSPALTEQQIKDKEGEEILKRISNSDVCILLDDAGKQYTSMELAEKINKWQLSSIKQLVFVVGGAYGFSDEVYKRSNEKLSLSRLTFSHQMVRMIFKEQLYRAYTILKNEPYHHR